MIPICTPNLSGKESDYLRQCIESDFVSSVGPFVDRFEELVATSAGSARAVATSCGTAGLHVALVALGVGPGDLVIVPTYTFIASANSVSYTGAEPWLFDVEPDGWTLDASLLADTLASACTRQGQSLIHNASGKRVAAIMAVFAMGHSADMDAIVSVAKANTLPLVVDAAAAIGATYKGKAVGQTGADLCVFSFNGNKTVTSGGGGAIVGNDTKLMQTLKHLTTTARTGDGYDHDRVGFNYRMTNIEAAVGCAQMGRLDDFLAAKRRIRTRYEKELAQVAECSPFPDPHWGKSSCWLSGIVLKDRDVAEIAPKLAAANIQARPFWTPMHLQTPYKDAPRTEMGVAEALWRRVLVLPSSTHLCDQDQSTVIKAVRAVLA